MWKRMILGKLGKKLEKCRFPQVLQGNFPDCPVTLEYPQSHISDLQQLSSSLRNLSKTQKLSILQRLSDRSPNFAPLPLPILAI